MTHRPLDPAASLDALLTAARCGDHAAVIQQADVLLTCYFAGRGRYPTPLVDAAKQEEISTALDTCARLLQFEREPAEDAGDRLEPEVRG